MSQKTFIGILSGFLLLLFGCGGGGGGGGGGAPTGENWYSGISSQATVSDENAAQIIMNAFYGGTTNASMSVPLGAVHVLDTEVSGRPMTFRYLVLPAQKAALILSRLKQGNVPSVLSAVHTEQINEPGDCGGSITGTISVDDATGDVSGSFAYDNFCINLYSPDPIYYSGNVEFAGNIDPSTEDINLELGLNSVTMNYLGLDMTTNGTMSMTSSGNRLSFEMNTYTRDNTSGKTYWYHNYIMSITAYTDYEEATISGRFYDPDYGYVDLSTEEPLRVNYSELLFTGGVLVAEGSQNTKVRLRILSSSTYTIEADADGDGYYDKGSGILYWDEVYEYIYLEDGSIVGDSYEDSYEPDNLLEEVDLERNMIIPDGTLQYHTLDPAGDVDHIIFIAESGYAYAIETSGCDTMMCIAYLDPVTNEPGFMCDDDSGLDLGSRIEWQCTSSSLVFIAVAHYSQSATGLYTISVVESPACDSTAEEVIPRR